MRMMMKVAIPVEGGNEAVRSGNIGKIVGGFLEEFRPEAAYFVTEGGERTSLFFLDIKESSQMPALAERFFQGLNARVSFSPAMTPQDLRAGLENLKA